MIDATVTGSKWLWGVWNHVGAALAVLALFGASIATFRFQWGIALAVVPLLVLLLFIEGAYRVNLEAKDKSHRDEGLPGVEAALEDGRRLRSREIGNSEEYRLWIEGLERWKSETRETIGRELSHSHQVRFHPGPVWAADVSGSFNETHNNERLVLDSLLGRLEEFLREEH